jgi:hypothetical protein
MISRLSSSWMSESTMKRQMGILEAYILMISGIKWLHCWITCSISIEWWYLFTLKRRRFRKFSKKWLVSLTTCAINSKGSIYSCPIITKIRQINLNLPTWRKRYCSRVRWISWSRVWESRITVMSTRANSKSWRSTYQIPVCIRKSEKKEGLTELGAP